MSANQLFDIAAALVIVAFGIVGFLRGFISSVMSFIGLFFGTYFAWKLSGEGTALFLKLFPEVDATIANIVAMAIIFFCVALVISLISRLLSSLISLARLSGANHFAGMLIGLATGFALIVVFYGVITIFAPTTGQEWMKISIFMNIAERVWPFLYNILLSNGFLDSAKHIIETV